MKQNYHSGSVPSRTATGQRSAVRTANPLKQLLLMTLLLFLAILAPSAMYAQQALPYSYGFENNDLDAEGWTAQVTSSSSGIYNAGTSSAHGGTYLFRFYYVEQSGYLVSPLLTGTDLGVSLSFYYKESSNSYGDEQFYVGYTTDENVTDPTEFTYGDIVTASLDWQEYSAILPAGTKRIAIQYVYNDALYLYLDDFNFEAPSSCPKPTDLTATLTQGNGTIATLSWTENGSATNWVLEYGTAEDFTGATSVNVSGTPSKVLTGLTAETTYYARVKASCGGGDESSWSNTVTFTPTSAYAFTVNDGTTTNEYVPFYGYWADSGTKGQFIIPAETLQNMAYGTINKLTFYVNNSTSNTTFTNSNGVSSKFEVYMGEVNNTTFDGTTFNDWTSLDKVMNAATLEVKDHMMVVTLDVPYQYMGGNLLIGFNETTNGGYAHTYWYGVEVTGASLGGYGTSFSQKNFLPKITFEFISGEAPTCAKPIGLTLDGDPAWNSAQLTWTPSSQDQTAWQVCVNGDEANLKDATAIPFTLTGLTDETAYTVKVRANCGGGDFSDWSNEITFTTPVRFAAPTNVAAANITATSAEISWAGDNDATSFNLRYREDKDPNNDFESSSLKNWTTIDADGDGFTWMLGSECGGVYLNEGGSLAGSGHNASTDLVTSGSYSNYLNSIGESAALTPDNYLVSPQITLGGSITFWACAQDGSYPAEHFGVAVSTTGNTDAADFTTIQEWTLTAKRTGKLLRSSNATRGGNRDQGTWYQYSVDLSAYSGKGYVAIRHFNCTDMFLLNVDDIVIVQPESASEEPWTTIENATRPYTIDNLTPETNYQVQVQSVYADGESKWAETVFTTLPSCMAPTDLAVSNIDKRSADLAWTPNGEEDAWQICINGDEENLINVTENPYTLTGLDTETTYTVKVRAYCDEQDQSAWSAPATFTTLVACPAPTNLAISDIANVSAVASWTGEGDFALEYGEDVWKHYDNGVYTGNGGIGTGSGSDVYWAIMLPPTMLIDQPLTKLSIFEAVGYSTEPLTIMIYSGGDTAPGTLLYEETVETEAANAFHEITLSEPVNFDATQNLWIVCKEYGTYPAIGCNNVNEVNGRWISLDGVEWKDVTSYGLDYTWMIRAAFGDTEMEWVTVDNATSPQEITGLTPETSYFVRVKHICGGIDGESDWVTTMFTTDVPCATPTALAATPYALSAKLSWVGTSDSYTVSYRQYIEGEKIVPDWQTVVVNEATAIITGLEMETQYEWKVQGDCGEYGVSEESTIATFTTTDNLCPTPTNLVADNITATTADLSWNASPDVESFTVRYRESEHYIGGIFEGFESGTMPTGWTQSGPGTWTVNEGYGYNSIPAHTGTYNVKIGHSNRENETYLITPVLDLSGATDPTLSFWYINYNWGTSDIDQIFVYYRVNEGEWVELWNTTEDHQEWTESGAIALPNPSANYQVGFKMVDKYGHGVGLDDIQIGSNPTLVPATEWQTVSTTETNVTLTGLTPGTPYEVQVKSDCSDPEEWSAVTTFTTVIPVEIELVNSSTGNEALIEANDGNFANVKLAGRTLYKDGYWNTICLPFDVTIAGSPLDGAHAKTISDDKNGAALSGTHVTLTFGEEVETLVAGTPYIIKWNKAEGYDEADPTTRDIFEPVFTDVAIHATPNPIEIEGIVNFVGNYNAKVLDPSANADDTYIYYMAGDNALKHIVEGSTRTLGACRAYFDFSPALNTGAAREIILNFGDGEGTTTAIKDGIVANENETGWYTVDGKKLDKQPARKGVYIHNGRKVVIK